MADKRPNNYESCLTKEKKTELGLSYLYCQEIETGFMTAKKVVEKEATVQVLIFWV